MIDRPHLVQAQRILAAGGQLSVTVSGERSSHKSLSDS